MEGVRLPGCKLLQSTLRAVKALSTFWFSDLQEEAETLKRPPFAAPPSPVSSIALSMAYYEPGK